MQNPRGPKSIPSQSRLPIPSQIQLPKGVVLKGLPFKIVAYNPDGSPKLFELQPPGPPKADAFAGECILFGREELLRNPWPKSPEKANE